MTRLLLVKTSSMGDVVHTMPAVTEALAARPGLALDWMVEKPFAPIVALHPGIGRIHEVETRRWRKALLSRVTWTAIRSLKADLRAARYDLVLDAQGLMKSALLAKLARAPMHGFDTSSARERLASQYYEHSYHVPRQLHAIDRTRKLFAQALGYELTGDGTDFGLAAPLASGDWSGGVFLLHGTSWDTKKWPLDNWIAIAADFAARGMTPVTTWASDQERITAQAIADAVPSTRIVPRSGLDAIAAILGQAQLVIGVDTGLTHLAAALGRPTVAIFVASRPGLTGPRGPRIAILDGGDADELSPVSRRDGPIGRIVSVDDVVGTAEALLGAG